MKHKRVTRIVLKVDCQTIKGKKKKPLWYIIAEEHFVFCNEEQERHPLQGRSWAPFPTRERAKLEAISISNKFTTSTIPVVVEEA